MAAGYIMEKELEIKELSGVLLESIKECISEALQYPTESTMTNLRTQLQHAKELTESIYRQCGGIITEDSDPEVMITKMTDAADYAVEMVGKREEFYIYMNQDGENGKKKRLHIRSRTIGNKNGM